MRGRELALEDESVPNLCTCWLCPGIFKQYVALPLTSTVTESGSAIGTPRRVMLSSSGQEVLLEQPALPPGAFGQ